ncbi:MAG: glycosyltransferase [Elusimicrobia bacterium]|nr:glycosyltransferase [Elusimicrobiota bacterium]
MVSADIIIIGYNEGKYLEKCFLSAMSARDALFNETGVKAKILYVDSQSTDDSVAIAQSLNVAVVFAPPQFKTCSNARTTGMLLADGDYMMFLDGDMEISPRWLIEGLDFLEKNSSAAGAAGIRDDMRLIGGRFVKIKNFNRVFREIEKIRNNVGGAFLLRRKALEQIGGVEPAIAPEEDYIMYAQLREKGWKLYRIAKPMIIHWDAKKSDASSIAERLLWGRRVFVSGAIFRHAFFHAKWWPYFLKLKANIFLHGLWLLLCAVMIAQKQNLAALTATLIYMGTIYVSKGDFLRTFAALFLRTAYLFNFLVGFIFNYPKLKFGAGRSEEYKNEVRKINAMYLKKP